MKKLLIVAVAVGLSGQADAMDQSPRPPKIVKIIKVEDVTFRVLVEGDHAKAASKGSAWFASVGAHYFSLARRAVEIASGCKVKETDNFRATLYTSLDCSQLSTAPAQ